MTLSVLEVFLDWRQKRLVRRKQSSDAPEGSEDRPAPDTVILASPSRWEGTDFAAYRESANSARTQVRKTVFAGLLLSVVGIIGLELSIFLLTVANSSRWPSVNLDLGIATQDATVIVAGMLTAVAALSIALAASHPDPGEQKPWMFAMSAVWAEEIATMMYLSAMVAQVTALSQIFARKTPPALTVVLISMALISMVLAASVRSWVGREIELRFALEAELAQLDSVPREPESAESQSPPTERVVWCSYIGFVALTGLFPAVAFVLAVFIAEWIRHRPFMLPWRWVGICFLVGTLVVWGLTIFTIQLRAAQKSLNCSRQNQMRGCIIFVLGIVLLDWLSLLLVSDSLVVDAVVTVAVVGATVVPMTFLRMSNQRPRGVSGFVFHRAVTMAENRRREVDQQLKALASHV